MQSDLNSNVKKMEQAALLAARHLIAARNSVSKIQVQIKEDSSLVMNLDIECERIIMESLAGSLPLVSEESEASHHYIAEGGDYFIIDPIDGTASCKRYLGKIGGDIGFGPLIGCVLGGQLKAAVYFDLPSHSLYSCQEQVGSFLVRDFDYKQDNFPDLAKRTRLLVKDSRGLDESGLLFFPGSLEECKFVLYARANNIVENTYRLGGFANDCTRLARNIEQIQLQCRVKAWDFSAVKFSEVAGLDVTVDPFGTPTKLSDWKVAETNPVLVCHPQHTSTLLEHLARSQSSSF